MAGDLFLTDGGLETTLVFVEGFDLPEFAAFVLLDSKNSRDVLRKYYRRYADIAEAQGMGFILEGVTWRASRDWGRKLGYSDERIDEFNRESIKLLQEIRHDYEGTIPHMVISGCLGPRGDGYNTKRFMDAKEAEAYHRAQIATFRETEADMVTGGSPAYYMINCAHPTHFGDLPEDGPWRSRIRAVRANASSKSHAELDEATVLDDGDPKELAAHYLSLTKKLPKLSIIGGCCGTDHRHILEICRVLREQGFRFKA